MCGEAGGADEYQNQGGAGFHRQKRGKKKSGRSISPTPGRGVLPQDE